MNGLLAQSYWMQRGGGASADEALSISLDANNNTYTTGYFTGSATFGTTNLNTLGISDIFVTKTNASGVYQWAVKAGDGGADRGLAIKADARGNSYITGYYYGTAKFGTQSITSAGLQDVFVAKYDANGNLKWVVSAGGSESDIGNAISIDNQGNVLIAGQFTGTATFGSFILTSTANNVNVFTAKLDSANGTFMWAKSGTGPHTDRGLGVACDPSNNVYVTGQFSDTITFGSVHFTPLYNGIFLIKYNSTGTEQWFTTAGGGTSNIANAIAVDRNSNIYLTGDFTGSLSFFLTHLDTTITNIYANKIFIAKYYQDGNLDWAITDGSSNPVTATDISTDSLGNPFIIGNFECIMNGYADRYGQGTFNSVGYWDILTAGYSTSNGSWIWSRQIGGHTNNYGYGIAIGRGANIYTAGSFDGDMIITTDANFIGYKTLNWLYGLCNNAYCSDSYYGQFAYFNTAGSLDIFIAEPIDLNRQPYDFYIRSGNSCNRDFEGVCINNNLNNYNLCMDSVQFCGNGNLYANSNTCSPLGAETGPDFNYLWSNGSTQNGTIANHGGWYYVTQTSADGCFKSKDSIYVTIHPVPKPNLSDNVIINTNSTNPQAINLCMDSCLLWGGNHTRDSIWWTGPILSGHDTVTAKVSGVYCFNVKDSFGCINSVCVVVTVDSTLQKVAPKMICEGCSHDTIYICRSTEFDMYVYDSISNPLGIPNLCIPPGNNATITWTVTPTSISYSPSTNCAEYDNNQFLPTDSGWYNITATVTRDNFCDTSVQTLSDSIYVKLLPQPKITISGKNLICPGDSEYLVVSGSNNYDWSTGSTNDSILVNTAGYYFVTSISTDGCSTTELFVVSNPPLPNVTMNPSNGLICPGDSVTLTCSGSGIFQWQGPSGPFGGNNPVVYVKTPGSYNCVVTDSLGCLLLSNTVTVTQYSTPFLITSPSTTLCAFDTAILSAIAPVGATINWAPPLTGHDSVQIITTSGTYSCTVISCGITTNSSVTITFSNPVAAITPSGPTNLCAGDSVTLTANNGLIFYTWNPGNTTTQSVTVNHAGTYTLTTIDAYGCSASNTITINQSTLMKDTISALTNVACFGANTGIISIGIKGGTPSYTYSWSSGGGSTATETGLSAGTYTITTTDAYGCIQTTTASVWQPPSPLTDNSVLTNVNCYGNSTGSAAVVASGGAPGYTYLWNPGGQTVPSVSNLSAGSYNVIITDSAGCSVTSSISITQPAEITTNLIIDNATCLNDNGAISVMVNGGTSPYSYRWSPGGATNAAISGLSSGSYKVTLTDANGCIDTTTGNIGLDNNLTVNVSGSDSLCKGQSDTLIASGATNYLWSVGSTNSSIIVSPSATTNYWVIGTTGVCKDSVLHSVAIYMPLFAYMPLHDSTCPGKPVTLKVNVGGGKPTYSYAWNNGISSDSPGPITVYPTSSITYIVTVTDECDYKATDSVHIKVFPVGNASFIVTPSSVSAEQPVTFTNTSQNTTSYYWNFGDGSSSTDGAPTHEYANTGTYQVVLTAFNSYGCADTATEDVYVTPEIIFPNVFTPNSDGKNDILYFTIGGATCFHCNIYNRWGQLVCELNDADSGWDGKIRQTGEPASDGTYYYVINYCDYKNVPHNLDGYVQLIRSN
jgi:gliding motility-associated-like protein